MYIKALQPANFLSGLNLQHSAESTPKIYFTLGRQLICFNSMTTGREETLKVKFILTM